MFLHKSSRIVSDWCKQHDIGVVIIGKNDGWKQEINIGKVNNQHFVNIPHATLIEMITYKLEEEGIHVQLTEESYTSKCDHLAYEPMRHQEKYLGKRSKRGLFVSSTGRLINADVNGAIGIARKVMGDAVIRQLLHRGFAQNPVRVNPLIKP
jgi:putative transposase